MKENRVEVEVKFYEESCKGCPSLLRSNVVKSTKSYTATVYCMLRNPECLFVKQQKKKTKKEKKTEKEVEKDG